MHSRVCIRSRHAIAVCFMTPLVAMHRSSTLRAGRRTGAEAGLKRVQTASRPRRWRGGQDHRGDRADRGGSLREVDAGESDGDDVDVGLLVDEDQGRRADMERESPRSGRRTSGCGPAQADRWGGTTTGAADAGPLGSGLVTNVSPPEAKLAFYARLFAARRDVYARYWENPRKGTKGWSPVVRHPFRKGSVWDRRPLPLTTEVLDAHLRAGNDLFIGLYPLLPDEPAGG